MNDLEKAKAALCGAPDITCALCCGEDTLISRRRGIAPLVEWLDEDKDLREYSAADKVVGNGAAFLYVLLGVSRLHAGVISKSALETLDRYHIETTYDTLTEAIRNRDNTGFCPFETAVSGITDPDEALTAIRRRQKELRMSK